jgi:uncharacterized protein involved in tolerance to divalent cations
MVSSMSKQIVVIRCTVEDEGAARSMSVDLLNDRLAFSVSIYPQVETHFIVDGNIQKKTECVVEIVSNRLLMNNTIKWLSARIGGDAPEVTAMAVLEADDKYLDKIHKVQIGS